MGTHPSGPSVVAGTEGLTLKDWLAQNPAALGGACHVFGPDLPFLFKARKARSAQTADGTGHPARSAGHAVMTQCSEPPGTR